MVLWFLRGSNGTVEGAGVARGCSSGVQTKGKITAIPFWAERICSGAHRGTFSSGVGKLHPFRGKVFLGQGYPLRIQGHRRAWSRRHEHVVALCGNRDPNRWRQRRTEVFSIWSPKSQRNCRSILASESMLTD